MSPHGASGAVPPPHGACKAVGAETPSSWGHPEGCTIVIQCANSTRDVCLEIEAREERRGIPGGGGGGGGNLALLDDFLVGWRDSDKPQPDSEGIRQFRAIQTASRGNCSQMSQAYQ